MKDSNLVRGNYRLAKVKEVVRGEDGHVRRVTLIYKNPEAGTSIQEGKKYVEVERSVQNVVVIVPADWTFEDTEAAVTSGLRRDGRNQCGSGADPADPVNSN